jgi:hypothetical protein
MQPKKNGILKIKISVSSISLSLLLVSQILLIPTMKNEVHAQQNPNSQQLISQISSFVEVISINVTSHNPNVDPEPDPDKIKQIIQGIGMQMGGISDTMAVQAMSEISSGVDLDPKGALAQSLIALSQEVTSDNGVTDIINNIIQRSGSIVDKIIDGATSYILAVANGRNIEMDLGESGVTSDLIPSSFSPRRTDSGLFFTASYIPEMQLETLVQMQEQQQQQQEPQQQKNVGISQIIKQIAQQVATANPGTNATHVYQVLVQLAKQTAAQTSSNEQAIQEIREIYSQVTTYPFGTVSQSLSHFAQQVTAGSGSSTNIIQIAQQIAQEKSTTGKNVSESVVNTAVQAASGATSNNINQLIRQTAQKIANQTGVSVEKIEAIIIQIALQIAQAQGKAVTGQSILEIANQIAMNPNGILAQAILQLVKQYTADNNGKTGQTVNIINNVVKSGGGNSKTIVKVIGDRGGGGGGDGKPQPTPTPTCKSGYHWDTIAKRCVPDSPPDPCIENPNAEGCEPEDPCIENPNAEGCEPEDPCIENPNAEGCEP